ncbi:MAG: ATP-dependent metallopeptidase FtsH/Yme1/Tma family protein, partial [Clostridia bacterium]|nr:ATP-dependent metallopeptidase FtsH/Yme1/Tma family protein [Clostridia bacterium]
MNKKTKTIIWIVVAIIGVALLVLLLTDVIGGAQEITFTEFVKKLASGEITQLYVDGYQWQGTSKTGAMFSTIAPSVYEYSSLMALMQGLGDKAANISISFTDPN